MLKIHRFFDSLFDQYSYSGKIRFVGLMVLSLCVFCIGSILYFQHDLINMYRQKIVGLANFRTLNAIQKGSSDLQVLLSDNFKKDDTSREKVVGLVAEIDNALAIAVRNAPPVVPGSVFSNTQQILEFKKNLDLIQGQWGILKNAFDGSPEASRVRLRKFSQLIFDASRRNSHLYRLNQGIEMIIFLVTDIVIEKLPAAQIQLTLLATKAPEEVRTDIFPEGDSLFISHTAILKRKIDQMNAMISQAEGEDIAGYDKFHVNELTGIFAPYNTAVKDYLYKAILNLKNEKSATSLAKVALKQGWESQSLMLNNLASDLDLALHALEVRKYATILITIIGFLIFLALYLTRLMHRPLEMLKSGANSLVDGDLSVRVPITADDEVSRIISAFNEMAATWEQSVYKAKMVADRLVDISTNVFKIAAELEDNVTAQDGIVESMKAEAKKIAATIQSFKSVLEEVKSSALATSMQAEQGRRSLTEIEDISKQMGIAATLIVDTLSLIEGQVDRIKGVLNTIVSIADQSNILSLNTAIRASQTGTSGGGFAVVALKIREMAEQIAFATLDIEKAIHGIVNDVSKATNEVEQFSSQISVQIDDEKNVHEKFSQRINKTQEQIRIFEGIYSDMEQLFNDTLSIDGMMSNLIKVSADTERAVRKLYNDSERLSHGTEGLQAMIERFRYSNKD